MVISQPYPARIPVSLERRTFDGTDRLGNPAESWGAPERWLVVAIAPLVTDEDRMAGHAHVTASAQMYAPISMRVGPGDRVTVRDKVFDVVGHQADADLGPWWDLPLTTISLRRIEAK